MPGRRRIWKDRVLVLSLTNDSESIFRLTGATQPDPEDSKGMTLVRCIGKFDMKPLVQGAVNGASGMWFGVGITSEEAFGVGPTVVSSVQVEAEFPPSGWLYRSVSLVIDSVDAFDQPPVTIQWDIRAQRKLMYGVPFLRVENAEADPSGFTVLLCGIVRCLYLMP